MMASSSTPDPSAIIEGASDIGAVPAIAEKEVRRDGFSLYAEMYAIRLTVD